MEALIKREIEQQRKGKKRSPIFKINSLVDKGMIQLLNPAPPGGVKIDSLVRGMCCLRPGGPGGSDNIKATSIVGRFLEHSRIFASGNLAAAEEVGRWAVLTSMFGQSNTIDRRAGRFHSLAWRDSMGFLFQVTLCADLGKFSSAIYL